MKKSLSLLLAICLVLPMLTSVAFAADDAQAQTAAAHAVPFSDVTVEDDFWSALQKQFVCKVIPVAISNISTATGGMENFRKAAAYLAEKSGNYTTEDAPNHGGAIYVDSDDYKVIEAMCYALLLDADGDAEILQGQAAIREQLEEWIPWIVGAEEADGYLYTPYTLTYTGTSRQADMRFNGRSDDMPVHTDGSLYDTVGTAAYKSRVNMDNHELYCAGHFYEAAVAHYRATGDFRLLDAAVKNADLVVRTCGRGPGQAYIIPGHQEIELALIKLAALCREIGVADGVDYAAKADGYVETAKFFLDARGRDSEYDRPLGGSSVYYQNDAPVATQRTAHGHCVRANYMYTAMADVALLETAKGNQNPYDDALTAIWADMRTKMYVHGGIGIPGGESYSAAYTLPNDGAYCETCAQISNVMWNQRMQLLYGDAKYADLMEWTLYNSVLSCVNLDGDRFFYQNHVTSHQDFTRNAWFGTACCPPNLLRTVMSIGGYIYTQDDAGNLTVNQYIGNTANLKIGGNDAQISMSSAFPWDGNVSLTVRHAPGTEFTLRLRIPDWATGENSVTLNGENIDLVPDEDGYLAIRRTFADGDVLRIDFPMDAERLYTDKNITANAGLVSVRRGPILYCAESPDNENLDVLSAALPADAAFTVSEMTSLPGKTGDDPYHVENLRTVSYTAKCRTLFSAEQTATVTLIPYYMWNNRGYSDMTLFLHEGPVTFDKPLEYYATVSASHTYTTDTLGALHDGLFAAKTRWTAYRSPTNENYIEYAFDGNVTLRGSWVTWYDDGGGVQAPDALTILYDDGGVWKPVSHLTGADTFKKNNATTVAGESYYGFDEIVTTKIRLCPTNTQMTSTRAQPGIVEWRLDGEVTSGDVVLPKIYEAENGTFAGTANTSIKTAENASANGCVGWIDNAASAVTMDIYVPAAGNYDVAITYAAHTSYPNASHKVYLGGDAANAVTVRYENLHNSWSTWETQVIRMELPAGANTLTVAYNPDLAESFARLDCIKLTKIVGTIGDINGDEKITVADALMLIRSILSGAPTPGGDVNGDSKVSLFDVFAIMKIAAE
ncbi:MAG: glycoside hydrolase family 127 protein [Clostridia bacterium]|nr:glycoside hydrolase family 127 protein [Clostridia bacterium]